MLLDAALGTFDLVDQVNNEIHVYRYSMNIEEVTVLYKSKTESLVVSFE